ncbi:MAG: hypothetical protein JST75_00845 [Bacteroidetes bacterium]|nr:hypothetical protein [Bacteroidota bacterium]
MKWIKFLLPLVFLFTLAGCFEIEEQIDVKDNGSGQLTVNTNMSQLLEMIQTYIGKDEMDKQLPKKAIDTTVLMKDVVDTAKNITPEKKALVRDGKIHMKLNMDEKIFKADMHFPFTSLNNLQQLYTSMNDGSLGTANLFKGLASGKSDAPDSPGPNNGNMPDMNQFNAIYDFQSKDGMISRKINSEKWKSLQESPEFAQMKQATNMGIEIPYTLIVKLPRPVKKIDNALSKLSDDKKTLTIKYNMIEVFEHPEKFEYTIAY